MLKGMIGVLASLFLVGLVFVPNAFAQDELDNLFDEGVSLFNRGRYDEALQVFQGVLAENPTNEQAFRFFDKTGHQVFLKMLTESGEYESVAKRFIELARTGRKEKEENGRRIEELVGQVVSGDQRARMNAQLSLVADHGEYAVEYMYAVLGSEDIEARVNVITSLARMGEEVVLPLIEVLHSDDVLVRRNAAAVLGQIGDMRSAPSLCAMAVLDDDEMNRMVASKSVAKFAEAETTSPAACAVLFNGLAEQYLNRDETVLKPYLASRVVWKWREGGLTKSPVYSGLYNLELAEEMCFQALSCEPGNARALALLAFSYAAQKAEVDAVIQSLGDDADTMPEELMSAAVNMPSVPRLVTLAGPACLNEALDFALSGDNSLEAITLISIMSDAGVFGASMERALDSADKLVRYNAALALAKSGDCSEKVVSTLVAALKESAIRQVLVIDDKSASMNALLTDLNEAGYFAVGADSGALGLMRAKSLPVKDLVVVRTWLKDLTVDKIVYEMAEGNTSDVPIMILADADQLDSIKEIWEGKVAGFISSPVNANVFLPAVEAAVGDVLNPERELALAMSVNVAGALNAMDANLLTAHMDALVGALDKPDAVKVPVLGVISRIGDVSALGGVTAIFGDENASTEVRVAAANALGAIFENMDEAPEADVLDLLASAIGSDEVSLSTAAGAAIGKANALAEGFKEEVLGSYRID